MKCGKCGSTRVRVSYESKGSCVVDEGKSEQIASETVDEFKVHGPYECEACGHKWSGISPSSKHFGTYSESVLDDLQEIAPDLVVGVGRFPLNVQLDGTVVYCPDDEGHEIKLSWGATDFEAWCKAAGWTD